MTNVWRITWTLVYPHVTSAPRTAAHARSQLLVARFASLLAVTLVTLTGTGTVRNVRTTVCLAHGANQMKGQSAQTVCPCMPRGRVVSVLNAQKIAIFVRTLEMETPNVPTITVLVVLPTKLWISPAQPVLTTVTHAMSTRMRTLSAAVVTLVSFSLRIRWRA